MIYCDNPVLEEWALPPEESLSRSVLTRMIAGGLELSNAVEYAGWDTNPVEPIVCESCWGPGCSREGMARIVRLDGQLLWIPPRLDEIDESWRNQIGERCLIRDSVLMPEATWAALGRRFANLPAADAYPRATRRDLARLWLHEMPEAVRVAEPEQLHVEAQPWGPVLASDPLELEPARDVIRNLCDWLRAAPLEPVAGRLVRAAECGAVVNTLYFEGRPLPEWPAFAVGVGNGLVVGGEWALWGAGDREHGPSGHCGRGRHGVGT